TGSARSCSATGMAWTRWRTRRPARRRRCVSSSVPPPCSGTSSTSSRTSRAASRACHERLVPREVRLPDWAKVGEKRREHIVRVTELRDRWAVQLRRTPEEADAWHDVGRLHAALRDAPEAELRALAGPVDLPLNVLHGPAAA